VQLRFNKVSELIHNSTNFRNLDRATVTVYFQEIIDKASSQEAAERQQQQQQQQQQWQAARRQLTGSGNSSSRPSRGPRSQQPWQQLW
jgi:hypothetical protein